MKKILNILLVIMIFSFSACKNEEKEITVMPKNTFIIQADYPVYDSADDIVDKADLIFSGTVKNISYTSLDIRTEEGTDSMTGLSEPSEPLPHTLYEIEIIQLYKGIATEDTITLKRVGGIVGDSEYILVDAPNISVGETYLFLSATFENSYPELLNLTQATYSMNEPAMINTSGDTQITLSQILEVLE